MLYYYYEVMKLKNNNTFFTTGEFAKKAGVTIRTLRYYDKIGLFKPSKLSDNGNRLYTTEDFARLQKILTLKFIGLSLEEIADIIKYDINDRDFKKSLEIQKEFMGQKVKHMHMVMEAIDETLSMIESGSEVNWNKFINIINVLNLNKSWHEQYENASNLRARIRFHELFSTNKYGWMRWYYEQLHIPENSRILELGCGDGSLWANNMDRIPDGFDITLTDFSEGMLMDAKKKLEPQIDKFKFKLVDAETIPFEDESFDAVIANHMLYHVQDIEKVFSEIKRVLKKGGYFYASTVGRNHMAEMRQIVSKFDSKLITTKSFDYTQKFQLENGKEQVSKWFKEVRLKRYEDNLIVTEPGPLIDYIFSMPGNVKTSFDEEKLNKLYSFLQNEINKNNGIFISKDTGFFEARRD